tara:strand:+ start:41146 stop:41433 length:288 start_codon:yes stop_codon:yes gene_type:complete
LQRITSIIEPNLNEYENTSPQKEIVLQQIFAIVPRGTIKMFLIHEPHLKSLKTLLSYYWLRLVKYTMPLNIRIAKKALSCSLPNTAIEHQSKFCE